MKPSSLLALFLVACAGSKDDGTDADTDVADTDTDTDTDTDADADADADADTDTDTDTDTHTGEPFTVPDPTGDPATVPLGGVCPLATRYGDFVVQVYEPDGYSIVSGDAGDGVVPITVLEEVGVEGDCVLLKRNNPFCSPPCPGGTTCDFDGTCIPYPANQDLGVVTVGGMAVPVVMRPVQPGNTYFETQLPHPVFAPGELVELRTWGGAFGDLELHGVGVEPLSLQLTEWVLYDGQDLVIDWVPPTAHDRAMVTVDLTIDQHGTTPISMVCSFVDDGAGVIPGALLSQLINAGVTGFPMASVTRRTVDSTTVLGTGCMEFEVGAPALPNPSVRVDGFTPCTSDKECPKGQTCDVANEICE